MPGTQHEVERWCPVAEGMLGGRVRKSQEKDTKHSTEDREIPFLEESRINLRTLCRNRTSEGTLIMKQMGVYFSTTL